MATRGTAKAQPRPYQAKDYDHLLGSTGFSDGLMTTHFQLYQGYVKNTNKALEILDDDNIEQYARSEVQRRFAWEYNGVRLHELYFDGMDGGSETPDNASPLRQAIEHDFGSWDDWIDDFRNVGTTRGIGWAALVHDPQARRLLNLWVNEHDAGPLARTDIILIMDVWEHAFMRDFGTDRGKYIDTYFDAVHWGEIEERLATSKRNATRQTAERQGEGGTRVHPRRS